MRIIINETPIEITAYHVLGTHNYKAAGVCFTTEAATIEEIEAAVGDGAEARIGANYAGTDLIMDRAEKKYGEDPAALQVWLIERPLEQIVKRQAEDLEAQAAAIAELAEIIGEGEA